MNFDGGTGIRPTDISSKNKMEAISKAKDLGDIALLKEDDTYYVVDIDDAKYSDKQKDELKSEISRQFGVAVEIIQIIDVDNETPLPDDNQKLQNRIKAENDARRDKLGTVALINIGGTYQVEDLKDEDYTEQQKEDLKKNISEKYKKDGINISPESITITNVNKNDEENNAKKGLISQEKINNILKGPELVNINQNTLRDFNISITPNISMNLSDDLTNKVEITSENKTQNNNTVHENQNTSNFTENNSTNNLTNKNTDDNKKTSSANVGIDIKFSWTNKKDKMFLKKEIVAAAFTNYNEHFELAYLFRSLGNFDRAGQELKDAMGALTVLGIKGIATIK